MIFIYFHRLELSVLGSQVAGFRTYQRNANQWKSMKINWKICEDQLNISEKKQCKSMKNQCKSMKFNANLWKAIRIHQKRARVFHEFSLIFMDFHWFSLIFIDFHWFSMIFIDFHWFFIDFSSIFIDFSMIFIDFHRFSLIFHWFSSIFHWFLYLGKLLGSSWGLLGRLLGSSWAPGGSEWFFRFFYNFFAQNTDFSQRKKKKRAKPPQSEWGHVHEPSLKPRFCARPRPVYQPLGLF